MPTRNERRGAAGGAAVVAALVLAGCGPARKPGAATADAGAVEAGAVEAGATSYLFAGEQVPRAVQWTRDGDIVGMSALALFRLPGGVIQKGASILDTQLPEEHCSLHKHNLVSLFDSSGAADRWLIGGAGFVSYRDPRTLAEIRRFDVGGAVQKLVLARNANVALVYSCLGYCTVTRIQLDTGAQASLGRIGGDEPLALTADGTYAAFVSDHHVVAFEGDGATPVFTAAGSADPSTVTVFHPEGRLLYGNGEALGSWDPKTGKSTSRPLRAAPDMSYVVMGDPVQGRIVVSPAYGGNITIYDGNAPKVLAVAEPGCGSAYPAIDDPTQFECPRDGSRIDAAGVTIKKFLGPTLRVSEHHALRMSGAGCEVADRATGRILAFEEDGFCQAHFSPDGTRLAWLGDDGTLQVQPLAFSMQREPVGRNEPQATVNGDTWLGRFESTSVAFGPAGFQRFERPEVYRSALVLTPQASFRFESNRIVATDLAGNVRLRALDLSGGQGDSARRTLHASGLSVVTNAYGAESKTTLCKLDADCREIELAPAYEVVAYEAPWIIAATSAEPDAPGQVVYYLRHDEAREAPRRVIVGRSCQPPLLLEHGDKLVCISDDRMVTYDTKTGQALGEARWLDLSQPAPPADERPRLSVQVLTGHRATATVLGHGDATIFVRTSAWLRQAIHIEERNLLLSAADAGSANPEPRSVASLTASYAVVRNANGSVRIGGDAAAAERLLACRHDNELLPWSTCKAASGRATP